MAGRAKHPLKINGKQWDTDRVAAIVIDRMATMDLPGALALGVEVDGVHYGLPSFSGWRGMTADRPDIQQACAQARKARAAHLVEEALQIADEEPERKGDGSIDPGSIRWAENRANQRKWMAERLDRDAFGQQVQVDMQLHASIDIRGVLAEARGRVIDAQAEQPPALPDDALDLFE
jgi:hypothetical protein